MSFQERFRAKGTLMNKQGTLEINSDRAVSKPSRSQIHSPVMKTLGKTIIEGDSKDRPPTVYHYHNLSLPIRNIESQAPTFDSPLITLRKPASFTPYSITDYYNIKPKKYYALGGVGPAQVGTREWKIKKGVNDRRKNYGFDANANNVKKISSSFGNPAFSEFY